MEGVICRTLRPLKKCFVVLNLEIRDSLVDVQTLEEVSYEILENLFHYTFRLFHQRTTKWDQLRRFSLTSRRLRTSKWPPLISATFEIPRVLIGCERFGRHFIGWLNLFVRGHPKLTVSHDMM